MKPLAICQPAAGTTVDAFVFRTVFVGIPVPEARRGVSYRASNGEPIGLDASLRRIRDTESSKAPKLLSFREFEKQYRVSVTDGPHARLVESHLRSGDKFKAAVRAAYDEYQDTEIRKFIREGGGEVTRRFAGIQSASDALDIVLTTFWDQRKFDPSTLPILPTRPRRTVQPLAELTDVGLLFLDRLRVRPVGHTVERGPFYELGLAPGETVTLRQRSFSKRASTLEETVEESEEHRLEYSSTFSTELLEQFSETQTESTNWNVTATIQGGLGAPAAAHIGGSLSGSYGASSVNDRSASESFRETEEVVRKVETIQKRSHKTVMEITTEESFETEAVRVITNGDTQAMKLFMRRMMQVLHLSYERYGVRMCWAPCIPDPGRDIRRFIPGEEFFAAEVQEIRDLWSSRNPGPEEVPPLAGSTTVCGDWSGVLSGGADGVDTELPRTLTIPSGMKLSHLYVETQDEDRDPNVYIESHSVVGATVHIQVHVGLKGWNLVGDSGNVDFRVCMQVVPSDAAVDAHAVAVRLWQQSQAQAQIDAFLEEKSKEFGDSRPDAWVPSELQRRLIDTFFNLAGLGSDCRLVETMNRLFEWESMSAELHAPWWSSTQAISGLQSLATNIHNAAFARVYVPLRPGYEEKALAALLAVGAIDVNSQWIEDIYYYLAGMRTDLEPLFADTRVFPTDNWQSVNSPADILLTPMGADDWSEEFERERPFQVLGRFTATIPTDGVDLEIAMGDCPIDTPTVRAHDGVRAAQADALTAISQRLATGDGTIEVSVSAATK